ncbi:hypothetical protein [Caenimonas sp. SL110]|uniref:hypothetical protein n=1 Tax=Caenimonas sp. SL110 TaxID=1450524 RepID=UPI000B3327C2|nr:hypothetical protein [Caenimonas sp. SL110]
MGMMMISLDGLLAPLHHLASWFAPRQMATLTSPTRQQGLIQASHTRPAFLRKPRPGIPAQCRRATRPLRVFRVSSDSQAAVTGARIAISGTMDDVCAELDRLAAIEASAR